MRVAVVAALMLVGLVGAVPAQALGPYPDLGSCQVFPAPTDTRLSPRAPALANQAAWHQDISRAPVARNSAAIIAYIASQGGDFLHPDFGSPRAYGFPYAVVGAGRRPLPIRYAAYGSESDPGPFPIPIGAPVEGGARSDGDRHVLVVDRSRCMLYELYRAFFRLRPRPHWEADSGASWDLRSTNLRPASWTSADAAGLPIFPGLVRYEEAGGGKIEHAIRVTFESTRDAWIQPATHCAGDTRSANAPPMGMRLRMKSGYDISGLTGASRVIAEALKRYGFLVADNGSNWFFTGTSDQRWNDNNLNQLKQIPGSAFEVVRSQAEVHAC